MDRNFADLPEHVDVVIFGTDITQSILAAACARNGLTVLHLDRNDYYGGKSCVFTFNSVEEFITSSSKPYCNGVSSASEEQTLRTDNAEETIYLPTIDAENFEFVRRDFPCCQLHIPEATASDSTTSETIQDTESNALTEAENPENQGPPVQTSSGECVTPVESRNVSNVPSTASWTKDSLIAASRRFNIDMTPNLVFSTGKTVELLISSDVARYVEFKNVGKLFVFSGETFENVPCSRADVFSDTRLSLVEKRLLMRLFQTALDTENKQSEESSIPTGLFVDYLRQTCRLPSRLLYFVQHAITMSSDTCTTAEGLARTRNFLKSCSIYGPTPFLWPMFGCAEFPQAFCRLAAVYGAIYILHSSPVAILRNVETSKCIGVILENGKRINCNFIASSSSYCPIGLLNKLIKDESSSLGYDLDLRAVFLSNQTLFPTDSAQQHPSCNYARVPQPTFTASIIELPDHAMVCPPGTFLHHVTATLKCSEKETASIKDHKTESEYFDKLLESLFSFDNVDGSIKPKIFWRFQFTNRYLTVNKSSEEMELSDFKVAENLFVLPDALSNDSSLDFDKSIAIAKLIFKEIKPDAEEFIPKMPQPPVSEDVAVADLAEQQPPNDSVAENELPSPSSEVHENSPSSSNE